MEILMNILKIGIITASMVFATTSNFAAAQSSVPTYSTTHVDFSLKTPDAGNPGTKITVSPHNLGKEGSATQQATNVPGVMVTIPLGNDTKK
jgi:hypothetical protein